MPGTSAKRFRNTSGKCLLWKVLYPCSMEKTCPAGKAWLTIQSNVRECIRIRLHANRKMQTGSCVKDGLSVMVYWSLPGREIILQLNGTTGILKCMLIGKLQKTVMQESICVEH